MAGDQIDRRAFIARLGGTAALSTMGATALADELEDAQLEASLRQPEKPKNKPGPRAEVRRGAGSVFDKRRNPVLEQLPAQPTLIDFFRHRFAGFGVHGLRSAQHALESGQDEVHIMAALVHTQNLRGKNRAS